MNTLHVQKIGVVLLLVLTFASCRDDAWDKHVGGLSANERSEERRVGKECR